jgi:hypothetical protein
MSDVLGQLIASLDSPKEIGPDAFQLAQGLLDDAVLAVKVVLLTLAGQSDVSDELSTLKEIKIDEGFVRVSGEPPQIKLRNPVLSLALCHEAF